MTLRLIVIVGATTSGKTRIAVDVAHRLGTDVVSADSRQVYEGLDIGSGKDLDVYRSVDPPVRCHLIDLVPPEETYTVHRYQQDCHDFLRRWAAKRTEPLVMAGGTGLYVEAVLRQHRIPNVPEDVEFREGWEGRSREDLVDALREASPELLERTDTSSRKRLIRALEIAAAGGARPSSLLGLPFEYRVFHLQIPRTELHRRIHHRLRARLDAGLVEEVQRLYDGGLPQRRFEQLGLEYREVQRHLRGDVGFEEMRELLELRIRQFAKRQETWFRGMPRRGIAVTPLEGEGALQALLDPGPWTRVEG